MAKTVRPGRKDAVGLNVRTGTRRAGCSRLTRIALTAAACLATGCTSASRESPGAADAAQTPFDPTYSSYAQILSDYVKGRRVDYAGLRAAQKSLRRVVDGFGSLPKDSLGAMSESSRISFYINAYNAITLMSVVEAYPVKSIKDISGVWKKRKWSVAGQKLTLDEIEHQRLRKDY
ncbi:MAG: DUF547 domain-containing protein, partial [Candidatus Zixiibacteriota bacterium]